MAVKAATIQTDTPTEEKIKNAARIVFYKKGFAATRTRDIAEEAGINLALLNYYFRSKQKLFDIIMLETLQRFLHSVAAVFNDEKTSLDNKIEILAERYIDTFIENPEVPLFIMSEIRTNPQALAQKMGIKQVISNSTLIKQYQQVVKSGKIAPAHPLQFLMNFLGLMAFPFVAKPLLKEIGEMEDQQFDLLMQERKKLVPKWIKATFKIK